MNGTSIYVTHVFGIFLHLQLIFKFNSIHTVLGGGGL
jgi:hypothetical protein